MRVLVLGIGNILFRDEGVGVRVVERLLQEYEFPEDVMILDGGVLGLSLLSYMADAEYMIVIDAIKRGGRPGTLYRLKEEDLPKRIRVKESLHEVDFLEAMASLHLLDRVPETVILGVEPEDIHTVSLELSPVVERKVEQLVGMVLEELNRVDISYKKRTDNVSCNSSEGLRYTG